MTNTEGAGAAAIAHETIERISIDQHAGVWRVALNGRFHGDYVRKYWALEAAFEKADEVAANGGAATITWTIDAEQDALLYDTRRPAPRAMTRKKDNRAMKWPLTRRWPPMVGESFAKRLLERAWPTESRRSRGWCADAPSPSLPSRPRTSAPRSSTPRAASAM
jgi:hypothetical protein